MGRRDAHTHTHTHTTHMHTHIHMHTHTHTTHMHTHIHMHTHTHYTHAHSHTYAHTHTHMQTHLELAKATAPGDHAHNSTRPRPWCHCSYGCIHKCHSLRYSSSCLPLFLPLPLWHPSSVAPYRNVFWQRQSSPPSETGLMNWLEAAAVQAIGNQGNYDFPS